MAEYIIKCSECGDEASNLQYGHPANKSHKRKGLGSMEEDSVYVGKPGAVDQTMPRITMGRGHIKVYNGYAIKDEIKALRGEGLDVSYDPMNKDWMILTDKNVKAAIEGLKRFVKLGAAVEIKQLPMYEQMGVEVAFVWDNLGVRRVLSKSPGPGAQTEVSK